MPVCHPGSLDRLPWYPIGSLPPPHSLPVLPDACLTPPAPPGSRQLKQVRSCVSLPGCVWHFMFYRVFSHLCLSPWEGSWEVLLAPILQIRKLRLKEVKSHTQDNTVRIPHYNWHHLQISIYQVPDYPQHLAGQWTRLAGYGCCWPGMDIQM